MKRAYIIHGWGESGNSLPWYNWLTEKLLEKGFEVEAFDMPDSENPKIENWVKFLEDKINFDEIDEQTFFIGHSIGCQTILRFLEKLHKHKRIGGCVFVAPWLDLINLEPEEMEIAHPWINSEIDFNRISDHDTNFVCIFSNDDPYVHSDEAEKFKDKLGAKIIVKEGMGHFEDADKIPEILEFVK